MGLQKVAVAAFIAVSIAVPIPAMAWQAGPRTLENLLGPAGNDTRDERAAPSAEPPRTQPFAPAAESVSPPRPTKRLPVPEQAAVDEALELIKQAYDEQIRNAAASPETAIRTFRETADKTTDAGRKYALLLMAERIALEAQATGQALDVVAHRAVIFEVEPLAARHELLAKISRGDGFRPNAQFFGYVVDTADRAARADQFDLADSAADLALTTAKAMEKDEKARAVESRRKRESLPKAVAPGMLAEAIQLQKAVRERRRLTVDYTTARDTLTASPDDDAAAEIVGRYLCCMKHDWRAGLAALAKGSHEGLRGLALRDIAMTKESAANAVDRLKLANDWWKLAEEEATLAPFEADAIRLHAGVIYGDIAAQLTDPIDATLARKRAKEMGVPEKPVRSPPPAGSATSRPDAPGSAPARRPPPLTLDALNQEGG